MKKVKVSVVIPMYRVEQYIANTVQSVLDQTYTDLELLIVNDGSPDRSVEVCEQFTDPRIRILHQTNQGVCAARNHGIRVAEGEYIAFLDGDDVWAPEKLEKHVQHLENCPWVGISYSHSAFIDEAGKPLGIYQISKTQGITPDLILCRNPIGNGSTPVIRREVLEEICFQTHLHQGMKNCYFDEQLHHIEDVECWLRIALQTQWKMEGIPEPLTLYRVTSSGASTHLLRQAESLEKVLAKTRAYAPDLIAQWGNAARAYQLRFLARRAVRLKASATAIALAHRAIATHWRILLEEPRRTLLTLAAAYSLQILPESLYSQLEALALRQTGVNQQRQVAAQSQLSQKPEGYPA